MNGTAALPDLETERAPRVQGGGTPDSAIDPEVFLATASIGRRDLGLAGLIVFASVLIFVILAPFAQVPLAPVPAFIPVYESALVVNDLFTAVLLFGQFGILGSRSILVLAGSYLFTAFIAIAHALSFPGLFTATGLLGAGPQSTAWIYMFWHAGFPLGVILYVVLKERGAASIARRVERRRRAILWATLVAAIAVAALTWLATQGADALPAIMEADHYTPTMKFVIGTVWALSVIGLVALAFRPGRTVLDLWLIVVLAAWLCDVGLATMLNAGRFDLGFYAGRIYGLLAASFVLGAMLLETNGLYGRLAAAARQLRSHAGLLEVRVAERTHELADANTALTQEIEQRRKTEAQLVQAQKMEAIGNLTGGMAHDFNNLLGVVIGNLDILQATRTGDPLAEELTRDALDAALKGADLTKRLLAFARRQPLQPVRLEPNELVSRIVKLLERLLGERIKVTLDLAPGVWPVVVDPAQLESSIANLATNARDAMPQGGELRIATANRQLDGAYAELNPDAMPGDYAMIEVSDTGMGIPADKLSHIFEPFFTTKEPGKGTGLGLAMVYGFIRQSRGHINVYSEVGVGTAFRLYLPRIADFQAQAAVQPGEEMPFGCGETILVVEDNEAMRRMVIRQLGELGYQVVEADNAEAALELLEQRSFDLVFTDIVLPGRLSGVELAHAVHERWPHLPVVLTSGFPGRNGGTVETLGRLLVKPYRKIELARAVHEGLSAKV